MDKNLHSSSVFGEKRSFEFVEWILSWQNVRLKVCTIYHIPYSPAHPVTNATFIDEIQDYFESLVLCNEKLLIAGDFNLHVDVEADYYGKEFRDILVSFGLVNHVSIPTHESGHTLDLLITRDTDELSLSLPKGGYFISDHCFVLTRLDLPRPNLQRKTVSYRKIKDIALPDFKSDLVDICSRLSHIEDADSLAVEYNSELRQCLDKHAPVLTKSMVCRPKVPYYNNSLRDLKRDRRKAEGLWRKDRDNTELRSGFKVLRNKYVSDLDSAHTNFLSNAVSEAKGDQRKLYNLIQSLTSVKRATPLPPHDSIEQLANDFGDFFVEKIEKIRMEIDSQNVSQPELPDSPSCNRLNSFSVLSESEVKALVLESKSTSCELDPIPTSLLKECIDVVLPILTKMVNLSLQTGIFPDIWKLALIIPLIKKFGLELIFKSFRPVSNLPFVGKLAERAVIKQDTAHMNANCPLPPCSSAYRPGHSTETALVKVHSDILGNMEKQLVTLLVLIDLSAAFDTVDHSTALKVLHSKFGISGVALEWHQSYLYDRKQCVNLCGVRSNIANLAYGVPQGSCLGPVMFTQYASTLFEVIHRHIDNVHGYADDHQLYLAFSPDTLMSQQEAITCMENCLVDVKTWMLQYKLKMNDSKTEFLIIGSRQQLAKISVNSITVGGDVITAVDSVRDLGAYLDKQMSMEAHIHAKCKAAFKQLYNLRRIRKYLTREATETLVHSFIFSHIDYCNALLYGLPQYQIKKLQRIQNMAARLVFQQPKFSHVTPLFTELHWLRVEDRIKFKLLVLTFKGVHKMAPSYICDMFQQRSNKYSSRSSTSIEKIEFENGVVKSEIKSNQVVYLNVPKTCRETFMERSLVVAGPILWNSLPDVLRCETDFDNFKKVLKTYLFKNAYFM